MPSPVSRHIRVISSALILALGIVASAECVFGEDLTPAEMACCAAMSHDCAGMAQKQDCCAPATPRVDQGSAVTRTTLTAPHVTSVQLPIRPAAYRPLAFCSAPIFSGFAPKPPGVPTYLLISTFRI